MQSASEGDGASRHVYKASPGVTQGDRTPGMSGDLDTWLVLNILTGCDLKSSPLKKRKKKKIWGRNWRPEHCHRNGAGLIYCTSFCQTMEQRAACTGRCPGTDCCLTPPFQMSNSSPVCHKSNFARLFYLSTRPDTCD